MLYLDFYNKQLKHLLYNKIFFHNFEYILNRKEENVYYLDKYKKQ